MIGEGFLRIYDYSVLLEGEGELTVGIPYLHHIEFEGEGELVALSSANYGYAMLPALGSFGGIDLTGYGASASLLPALVSSGVGGLYVPPDPEYAFSFLPAMVSTGTIQTSCPGSSASLLPALSAIGGIEGFGFGSATMPALMSFGWSDNSPYEGRLISTAYMFSGAGSYMDTIVIISEVGEIAGTITATREQVESIIANIQASGIASAIGSFIASAISDGTLDTSIGSTVSNLVSTVVTATTSGTGTVGTTVTVTMGSSGEVITTTVVVTLDGGIYTTTTTVETSNIKASFDSDSRVWVVNLDTAATSQYDNYGYNSFYTYEGKNYGVAEDGIYELTGDTDNGFQIDSLVDFGRSDLGSDYKKRVTSAYLGVSSSGKLLLTAEADGQTRTFEMKNSSTTMTKQRFNMGSILSGYYWNFVLTNDGYDFDIEKIMFEIMQLNRRV